MYLKNKFIAKTKISPRTTLLFNTYLKKETNNVVPYLFIEYSDILTI